MTPIEDATQSQKRFWHEHKERQKRLNPAPPPASPSKWKPRHVALPPTPPPKWLHPETPLRRNHSLAATIRILKESHKVPRAVAIRRVVAASFGVDEADIIGQTRSQKPTLARHVMMFLTRESMPGASFPFIGRYCGRRDHTTVMFAVEKIRRMIESNSVFAEQINELRVLIDATRVQQSD